MVITLAISQVIWSLEDKVQLQPAELTSEKELEDLLAEHIEILNPDWLLVGRQVRTVAGKYIDLLCMDHDGDLVVVELKKDLTSYVELKLELLKLNTYERTGKVISVLSYGLVLLFLAFFCILFLFLALGFYLGEILNSIGAGFGIVAVLYVLIILLTIKNKQKISTKVVNEVIAALLTNDGKNNQQPDSTEKNNDPAGNTAS